MSYTSFQAFEFSSDGCIYDRIEYKMQAAGGGDLPMFATFDASTLTLCVSTNGKAFVGVYNLELVGLLNPEL